MNMSSFCEEKSAEDVFLELNGGEDVHLAEFLAFLTGLGSMFRPFFWSKACDEQRVHALGKAF